MKIGLVQFEVSVKKNFQHIANKVYSFLIKLQKEKCDLVCFPEDFWFGPLDLYSANERSKIITDLTPKAVDFLQSQALRYKLTIVAGSFIEKHENKLYNVSSIIGNNGLILSKYKKQHLVPFGFEQQLTPGNSDSSIFLVKNFKIGVVICRDLLYPQTVRNLREKGIDVVIIPSYWSKRCDEYLDHPITRRYPVSAETKVVDALCQARSFENEVIVCYVNAAGRIIQDYKFDILMGRSQICIPFYGCVQKLPQNREGVIVYEVESHVLKDARKAYRLFT